MDDDSPIMAAVSAFYKKCYKDERVAHWFKGISAEAQKRKLASFAYYAFGGEVSVRGLLAMCCLPVDSLDRIFGASVGVAAPLVGGVFPIPRIC